MYYTDAVNYRITIAVVLLSALFLVACGGGGEETGSRALAIEPTSLDKPAVYFIHTTW